MSNSSSILLKQIDLLKKAELPSAKCIHLKNLLEILKKDKNTAKSLHKWDSELQKRDEEAHASTACSVEWIRDKINCLRRSKWINHKLVNNYFEIAEAMIFCINPPTEITESPDKLQDYNRCIMQLVRGGNFPLNGFVGPALNILDAVTERIVEFGEKEIFIGWAEVEEVEGQIPLNKLLPSLTKEDVKKMNLADLCAKAGYGFSDLQIAESRKKDAVVIAYKQSRLVRLILPPFISTCLDGFSKESLPRWIENRDTDPITLYHFLKILSQYQDYKTLTLNLSTPPSSWEAHELVAVKLSLKEYFRTFSALAPENHVLPAGKINDLIDTFLLMLEIEVAKLELPEKKQPKNSHGIRSNLDEHTVKKFILKERKNDPNISRDSMVAKIQANHHKLNLKREYAPSTYKDWDRAVDPEKDMKTKLKRPKKSNR
jgi:hypothetical protein